MKIYIASSWKNQHCVEMLTEELRLRGITVLSFVENNYGEHDHTPFDEWCESPAGLQSFSYDTDAATKSDLVIYVGPSGTDAWAEVGAAWASHVPILGLWSKGEQAGLMRKMVTGWHRSFRTLLEAVQVFRC